MKHTMFKTDIIKRAAAETRLSRRVVSDVIDAALRVIAQGLKEGKTVTFPGFGTFYTREKQAGQARNFQTNELMTYPARRQAAFRPGEILKRAIRGDRRRGGARRRVQVEDEEE
jgi:DNA-binding protein HU-beta